MFESLIEEISTLGNFKFEIIEESFNGGMALYINGSFGDLNIIRELYRKNVSYIGVVSYDMDNHVYYLRIKP